MKSKFCEFLSLTKQFMEFVHLFHLPVSSVKQLFILDFKFGLAARTSLLLERTGSVVISVRSLKIPSSQENKAESPTVTLKRAEFPLHSRHDDFLHNGNNCKNSTIHKMSIYLYFYYLSILLQIHSWKNWLNPQYINFILKSKTWGKRNLFNF